jgi:FHS family L-fucose permease-like MFS transporter
MAEKKNGNVVAIITMIFLFGMISFVTGLAAPIGNIWKADPHVAGSNTLGMMGNMMNFLAYLFMGIPAGKLLSKAGYKKTALYAIAIGVIGVFVQFLCGKIGSWPTNFVIYLLGAFISGFSVCMLNTVVNPMLTLLGGGGKRGNQYVQIGGTFNSLMATLTPMLVGGLVGQITPDTKFSDVNLVLYIAMGVFVFAFIVISLLKIEDPEVEDNGEQASSPMKYRNFVFGIIAIFLYVGVEVGIPGTLNFYLSDTSASGAGLDPSIAVKIGGFVAGTYWFMMLIGRFISSFISGVVSSRTQLATVSSVAIILILWGMFADPSHLVKMPGFSDGSFGMYNVPLTALLFALAGLCTSVMWGTIFNLSVEGLGKATAQASGIFMMLVVGGGIIPLIQNGIADKAGYMASYWVVVICLAYILFFAVAGSRVKKQAAVK